MTIVGEHHLLVSGAVVKILLKISLSLLLDSFCVTNFMLELSEQSITELLQISRAFVLELREVLLCYCVDINFSCIRHS